jgi:pyruvate/2-oxoglutarate dehydrogenase complex dihydrolipoamide dehydrogenase (E3) component
MAIKCVIHSETERFLGCIAIGSVAAEIINLVSVAIATGRSAGAVANLPAVHPSATEALVRTLRQRFEHPVFV